MLPNLVPFQPSNWSAPLVVTDKPSPFADFPPPGGKQFVVNEEVYLHWAIINKSAAAVATGYEVWVSIDGVLLVKFALPKMGAEQVQRRLSYPITISAGGPHTIALVADAANQVAEGNEQDNTYSVTLAWVEPTPTPTRTPTPSPSASTASPAKPNVQIACIFFDGLVPDTEADEYVQIANLGNAAQDLAGWTLRDISDGQPQFTFPSWALAPGGVVRVYTNEVHPQWGGFSFGQRTAIWSNQDPDTAGLHDQTGRLVSSKSYPPGCP